MARVVVSPLKLSTGKSVKTKRIRGVRGSTLIRVVDGESPTLASDLTHVFRANVTRARADNAALRWSSAGVYKYSPGTTASAKKAKNRFKKARIKKRKVSVK